MRITQISPPGLSGGNGARLDLAAELRLRIIGQEDAVEAVAPFVEIFQAGLSPIGRP